MRIPTLSILAVLAVAAPASASQVLEYRGDGRLVAHDNPYLPPRQGPEAVGYERGRPVPHAKAHGGRGPSIKAAVDAARRHGDISASTAAGYDHVYSHARSAGAYLSGQRREELS